MTTITDFSTIRPSFLLDFANSGRVDPRISCVRASTATCCGPDGKRRTVASNVPRIDYDQVTGKCLGLLVEEARTNFILNSGDLSQSAWVKSRATAAAPDADGFCKVVEDGSNNSHYVSQTVTLSASDRVVRLLVKAGERTKAQIEFTGNTGNAGRRVVVDLVAGTVLSNSLIGSGGLTSSSVSARLMGAGVTELTMQVTPTATTGATANLLIILHDGIGVSYQGDGVSGIYVKEVQGEAGVFSTSYIPTDAAAVTRAADIPVLNGIMLPKEWTVLSEQVMAGFPPFATLFSVDSPGVPSNLRVIATSSGNNRPEYSEGASSTNITALNFATGTVLTRRAALACNGSSIRWALNGVASADAILATKTQVSPNLRIGLPANSAYAFSGWISRLAIYPAMLSAAQIKRITA